MHLAEIDRLAHAHGLHIMGTAHHKGAVVLLGTAPDFWPIFSASAEAQDGLTDPMDRWSKRVIGAIAQTLGATAQFPSDGPPFPPFIRWAFDSNRFFQSPVGMLVHDTAGMMISLRGALLFDETLPDSTPVLQSSPCSQCPAPCSTACPVNALSADAAYDVEKCHSFLDTESSQSCMTRGCIARRACPLSDGAGRSDAQSAFHMRAFHP
ncbi:4Fe-4S dicluster domain-containing protein [Shimia marina]|uniref:4Fe-4S ferredoxin-type domain-containing protein n=1 Tax=Shimia marina TaxID=321267 RepID=A0A0P1F5Y8_9RHOB|nr:hypothetical protein [Shimia marina]CUH50942.1 hypothetical protein SHM7688_00373 [Shimia marina]SFE57495.1 hypothetical protein SAMN04488037_111129 [Shimia marina]